VTCSKEPGLKIQKYIQRIGNSLAGKPDLNLPEIRIRQPEILVKNLVQMPESAWWKYAFSREPMNGRFDDSMRYELYEKACECGRNEADRILKKYPKLSVEEIARQMGLNVLYPDIPQASSRILFADFAEPATIRIYQDGLSKGHALMENPLIQSYFRTQMDHEKQDISDVRIEDILIAHELYHVIEMKNQKIWTQSYQILLWKIGFIENRSPVAVLSEIAAMAFASRLNHLNFSAYMLDAFLVYGYSPKAACALYDEMQDSFEADRMYKKNALKLSRAVLF